MRVRHIYLIMFSNVKDKPNVSIPHFSYNQSLKDYEKKKLKYNYVAICDTTNESGIYTSSVIRAIADGVETDDPQEIVKEGAI
ncbi:MAG: hypothetical protein MJ066_05360 [Clostridia bacterium]|nr:hypothetical protein [Clostridia bacterium]